MTRRIVHTLNFFIRQNFPPDKLAEQAVIGTNLLATLAGGPKTFKHLSETLWDVGSLFEYQVEEHRERELRLPLLLLGTLTREAMAWTYDIIISRTLLQFNTFFIDAWEEYRDMAMKAYETDYLEDGKLRDLPDGKERALEQTLQNLVVKLYHFIKADGLTPVGMQELYAEILEVYAVCRLVDRELEFAIETEFFIRDRMGVLQPRPEFRMSDDMAHLDDGVDYIFALATSLLAQPGYILEEWANNPT